MTTETVIDPHILQDLDKIADFIQAGKATFTLRNTVTKKRVTYKVALSGPRNDPDTKLLVYVLAASDNDSEGSYDLLGTITDTGYHFQGPLNAALALKEVTPIEETWLQGFLGSVLKNTQAGNDLTQKQRGALRGNCERRGIPLSHIRYDDHRQMGFAWLWRRITSNTALPPKAEVWHEGSCGRCGRKLTVPESIENGLGPVCAGLVVGSAKVGVA